MIVSVYAGLLMSTSVAIVVLDLSITTRFISRELGMASCFTGSQMYVTVLLKPFERHVALETEERIRLPEGSCALGRGGQHSREGGPLLSDEMST